MTRNFGLFDWIFIIYFVIFKLKVFAYKCINHNGNGADQTLPETIVLTSEATW